MVPPRGPPRRFCCGAAARAGERLQNKAGEVSPDPSYCAREACRRRNPPQTCSASPKRCSGCKRSPSGGRRPEPRCLLRSHRTRTPHGFALRWGRPGHLAARRARDSVEIVSGSLRRRHQYLHVHLSRRATLCQSALLSLRQAVKAVGSYAQGLSCLAESRQGGNRHPLLPARRKARATAVRGSVGSRRPVRQAGSASSPGGMPEAGKSGNHVPRVCQSIGRLLFGTVLWNTTRDATPPKPRVKSVGSRG